MATLQSLPDLKLEQHFTPALFLNPESKENGCFLFLFFHFVATPAVYWWLVSMNRNKLYCCCVLNLKVKLFTVCERRLRARLHLRFIQYEIMKFRPRKRSQQIAGG